MFNQINTISANLYSVITFGACPFGNMDMAIPALFMALGLWVALGMGIAHVFKAEKVKLMLLDVYFVLNIPALLAATIYGFINFNVLF